MVHTDKERRRTVDNEYRTMIYDRLFQLRNSMDKHIRQLQDMQNILNIIEFGFEYIQEDNTEFNSSVLRMILDFLKEFETNMLQYSDQISRMENMIDGTKDKEIE